MTAEDNQDLDPAWLKKLDADLKDLERTDPKVAEAKRKYDAAAKKVLALPLPTQLLLLDRDELALGVSDIDAPADYRSALLDRPEVLEVREAILSGDVTEADVARWVAIRLQAFKQGEHFAHERAFCALVVALEAVPTPSAKGFIDNMAASQAHELSMLPKVANECLKARLEAKLDPPPQELQLAGSGKCHCGVEYIVIRQAGKDTARHKEPVCELFNRTGRVSLSRVERRALAARKR